MSSLPRFDAQALAAMAPDDLRALTAQLLARIEQDTQRAEQANQAIALRDAKIDKLSFELAQLRRIRFGVKSEQLDAQQRPLFEEAVQADIAALEEELAELQATPLPTAAAAKRYGLKPWEFPAVASSRRSSVSRPDEPAVACSYPMTFDSRADRDCYSDPLRTPQATVHPPPPIRGLPSPAYRLPKLHAWQYKTVLLYPCRSSPVGLPT